MLDYREMSTFCSGETLPQFIVQQRWYVAEGEAVRQVALLDHAEWNDPRGNWFLALFRVDVGVEDRAANYFLPLALIWESDEERTRSMQPVTIALDDPMRVSRD